MTSHHEVWDDPISGFHDQVATHLSILNPNGSVTSTSSYTTAQAILYSLTNNHFLTIYIPFTQRRSFAIQVTVADARRLPIDRTRIKKLPYPLTIQIPIHTKKFLKIVIIVSTFCADYDVPFSQKFTFITKTSKPPRTAYTETCRDGLYYMEII